jgi:putative sigma-54 modulation protein
MELQFTSKHHLELTPALKDYATKKLAPMEERFQHITIANIVFHIDNLDHCAEGTIRSNGYDIHASAIGGDLYEAIDKLADKLFAQLTKHKEKNIDEHR